MVQIFEIVRIIKIVTSYLNNYSKYVCANGYVKAQKTRRT